MTSSDQNSQKKRVEISPENLPHEFTRAVAKARTAILWENVWPRVVPPAAVTGLFLSASFAGVWGMASPVGRMAGVVAFTLALAASPFRYKTGSLHVSRDDALKRLDKNLGDPLNPAQILGDRAADSSSESEKAKWNLHISNIWENYAGKFDAGMPRPGMAARDPYHLRFFIALTLAVTAALSQGPHIEQVKQAFDWTTPIPPPPPAPPLLLKAWVTPPDGINKEPLQMTEATRDDKQGGQKMVAHQNSVLTIMTYGSPTRILVNGQEVPLQKEIPQGKDKTGYQYEVKLEAGEATIKIQRGPEWHIAVDKDLAPTVTIKSINPVETKNSKALDIDYQAKDDNGYQGEILIETETKPDPAAKPLPSGLPPVLTLP